MALRIRDIADAIGAQAFGDLDLLVEKPSEPAAAGADDLALAMSPRYADELQASNVNAAVIWSGADWQAFGLKAAIVVERSRLAMSGITQAFDLATCQSGISPNAEISESGEVGDGVSVGAFSSVGAGAQVGNGTVIDNNVSIAAGSIIGSNCVLHAGVRICRNVEIGDDTIIQPNAVIGGDGFSFATAESSNEERAFKSLGRKPLTPPNDAKRHRVHSLGGVKIGSNVEIGANATIDAGTIRPTSIGDGTKIDNLVQVGHNVKLGADCVLSAQTAIAGSTIIGDRCVLGGKSGVKDNITLGNDVVLAGGAIVLQHVPDGRFMMGYPAMEMQAFRERQKNMRNLPRLLSEWLNR